MKTTNRKKVGVIAIIVALLQQALAFIWLVIAIAVIIVGIIVIYNLWKTIERVLPEKKANVTRIWLDSDTFNGWVYDDAPPYPALKDLERVDNIQPITFNLQYCLYPSLELGGASGRLMCGTNLQDVIFSDVQGDAKNNSAVMTGHGQIFKIICTDGIYTAEIVDVSTNTRPVIIEWSPDLIYWQPINTNLTVDVYTVMNFEDKDAPTGQGFYRLRILPPNPP